MFEKIRTNEFYDYPDGKHYIYRDGKGNRVGGSRCHDCCKNLMTKCHRRNGILERACITENGNAKGFRNEIFVKEILEKKGYPSVQTTLRGSDLTLHNGKTIEVKTACDIGGAWIIGTLPKTDSDFIAIVFEESVVVFAHYTDFKKRKSVSVSTLKPGFVQKRGKVTKKIETFDIDSFCEILERGV